MGTKQLDELMNAILRKAGMGNQSVSAERIDNNNLNRHQKMVLDVINDEIEMLLLEYPWMETQIYGTSFETNQGQDVYELEGVNDGNQTIKVDPYYIENLRIEAENREIHSLPDDKEWTDIKVTSDTNSLPQWWRLRNLSEDKNPRIELYPNPDDTYVIHYDFHEQFTRLTNSTDKSPVNDQLVILGSTMSLLDHEDQNFQLTMNRYQRLLQQVKRRNKDTEEEFVYGRGKSNVRERGNSERNNPPQFPSNF